MAKFSVGDNVRPLSGLGRFEITAVGLKNYLYVHVANSNGPEYVSDILSMDRDYSIMSPEWVKGKTYQRPSYYDLTITAVGDNGNALAEFTGYEGQVKLHALSADSRSMYTEKDENDD